MNECMNGVQKRYSHAHTIHSMNVVTIYLASHTDVSSSPQCVPFVIPFHYSHSRADKLKADNDDGKQAREVMTIMMIKIILKYCGK